MILVEKHDFTKNSRHFEELDLMCKKSKDLYNSTLYYVRQHFFKTRDETGHGKYLSFYDVNRQSKEIMHDSYTALPAKVAQGTQKLVDQNFKSFFALLKKKDKKARIPRYLDKDGRQVVQFTKQAISFNNRNVPNGYIRLSGLSFLIKTKVNSVQAARIVPKKGYITVEILYEIKNEPVVENDRYASIDIGVDNLASVTSNVFHPFIVNGKPVKSINHYYNKKLAKLQSKHRNRTHRMNSITRKRNNKISDYMHKASRMIVNHLAENCIGTLIIGYNKGFKQDTNMGTRHNQNFVQIPFLKFINMLTYKCALKGISVILTEESYTSKCSFLDNDYIPIYGETDDLFNPSGKRVKRGLYTSKSGKLINADINGSYNIMRKYLTKQGVWNEQVRSNCIEVCSAPSVFTVKQ